MKRVVFLFGDGSIQCATLDPARRRKGETEDEQIARLVATLRPLLRPSPVKADRTMRTAEEQAAYEASLGDGATPICAGVISEAEYLSQWNSTRRYREAWSWTTPDPVIDCDMEKARDIHRHDLRRLRAPKLTALDIGYQRADEVGDIARKAAIVEQKQVLRDVTADPAIAAAETPEALMAVLPAALR